ncbi:hypothetical protein [Acidithiobacillus sp.]|uniref:hypothetical protein n=1 Tax=Acidithiobacillus sp. TaxID=1872118 RepID=UPI0025B8864F|nr:hypothetical protein [Acidithiobacillus sp.]
MGATAPLNAGLASETRPLEVAAGMVFGLSHAILTGFMGYDHYPKISNICADLDSANEECVWMLSGTSLEIVHEAV